MSHKGVVEVDKISGKDMLVFRTGPRQRMRRIGRKRTLSVCFTPNLCSCVRGVKKDMVD